MNAVGNKKYASVAVFVFFILITFLLRLDTFFLSSYDWDESLYFLGAQSLLNGNLPYLEIWDHKPPMIFAVHALAIGIFGDSYIAIRILSCIFISIGAFGLFLLLKRESSELSTAGVFSGLLYILAMLLNGGKAANSELFYVPLIIYAFLLATIFTSNFKNHKRWSLIFFSGVLLGIASSINYLAALYSIPLGLYLLAIAYKSSITTTKNLTLHAAKLTILGAAGPFILFAVIIFLYAYNGAIEDFIYANFTSNAQYIHVDNQEFSIKQLVLAFAGQFSANWLTWAFAIFATFCLNSNERKKYFGVLIIAFTWLIASTLAILVSRLYWPHYFLQFSPAICILAGLMMGKIFHAIKKDSLQLSVIAVSALLIGAFYNPLKNSAKELANTLNQRYIQKQMHFGDTPKKIAAHISINTTADNYIYIVDYNPIIHALSNTKVPTKFVFPPFIIGKTSSKMLPTQASSEVEDILAKKPIYIIKKQTRPAPAETNDEVYDLIDKKIAEKYFLEATLDKINIYRLVEDH